MAVEGEIVIAEILAVVEREAACATPLGRAKYSAAGYVTVSSPWGYLTLMDGSVQGIPSEHRVVGKRIKLRWGTSGGYHGPMFAGVPNEEEG